MIPSQTAFAKLPRQLAEHLIDTKSLLPLKNKIPIVKFKDKAVAPHGIYSGINELAMLTGSKSGIFVLDIDSDFEHPFKYNTTTNKGGHVWFKDDGVGRSNRVNVLKGAPAGVDLRGHNGYARIYGPGVSFKHADVLPISVLDRWLSTFPSYSSSSFLSCKEYVNGLFRSDKYIDRKGEKTYMERVQEEGYTVDVGRVEKRAVTIVSQAKEGERNQKLYVNALHVAQVGGDVSGVVQAALDVGLETQEILATVDSATAVAHDRFELTPMARAARWYDRNIDQAHSVTEEKFMEAIKQEAVFQHSMRPAISQMKLAASTENTPGLASKFLKRLCETDALIKFAQPGLQPNGKRHVNNYELFIEDDFHASPVTGDSRPMADIDEKHLY